MYVTTVYSTSTTLTTQVLLYYRQIKITFCDKCHVVKLYGKILSLDYNNIEVFQLIYTCDHSIDK